MIVVSDTSPLSALLTTEQAEILTKLFSEVIVPEAVRDELLRKHASLPQWIKVANASNQTAVARFLETVDAGEAQAIELAKEIHADRLLIDERRGRRLAVQQGLAVIGSIGIALLAKRSGLIPSVRQLLDRLEREGGLYISTEIRESALKSIGE